MFVFYKSRRDKTNVVESNFGNGLEKLSLITFPELPLTSLQTGCYQSMFDQCTLLVEVPELSATTLDGDCYRIMSPCFGVLRNMHKE